MEDDLEGSFQCQADAVLNFLKPGEGAILEDQGRSMPWVGKGLEMSGR